MARARYTPGMDNSQATTLIRVDPDKHMNRRYSVFIQATLLEPAAVVCVWGSRRSSYQRLQVHPASTQEEARQLGKKIVQRKIRRGYRLG